METSQPSKRNERLGVIDGIFAQLGMNLTHPSMVLSLFVRELGGSNTLIGLLPAIRFAGWFMPQYLVAGWLQSQPRKARIAALFQGGRLLIYILLTVLTFWFAPTRPTLTLILFFLTFILSRLLAGSGGLARMDAIGKLIPPKRRSIFFATRSFWGGLAVFFAGFLIRYILDPARNLPFPIPFTILFILSCLTFAISVSALLSIREAPTPNPPAARRPREQLAQIPHLLRSDPTLRRYILTRILFTMNRLAEPFYPIFALDILGAPASIVGIYLSAATLSRILANLIWQYFGRRHPPTMMLRYVGLFTILPPVLAIALPWTMRTFGLTTENYGDLPAYLFTLVYILAGVAQSGQGIYMPALLLDIAPASQRADYVGLTNTFLGFVNLLPILSGVIVDHLGFVPVFTTASILLFLGFLNTLRWPHKPLPDT